jgi:hypothetical protein
MDMHLTDTSAQMSVLMHPNFKNMPAKRKEDLFLMTPLLPKETGLPMKVWFCVRPSKKAISAMKVNTERGDRVKPYEWVSVSVSDEPRILEENATLDPNDFTLVKRFINQNRDAILTHWNGDSDSYELIMALKKVK